MLFSIIQTSAQNLILNSSFEDSLACPTTPDKIYFAAPWFNPSLGSSDLFNKCSSTVYTGVPSNSWGYQQAKSGNGYAGGYFYNFREYIEEKFVSPLQAGKKYCVSFYVSLADSCKVAIGSIGASLSIDTVKSDTSDILFGTAQIQNSTILFIENKNNWAEIAGIYSAKGGEQFITIGNFNTNINTPVKSLNTGTLNYAYYYIDDVSLYQLIEAEAGEDKTICNGESATLGDAALPNTGYSWQPSTGLSNTTEAMPIANPIQTTTYTLTINYTGPNCTGKLTDTVTVHVNPCPGVYIANVFSPNNDGSNDVLKIEGNALATLYFAVYNRWGNLVFETHSQNQTWDGTQKGMPCEAGVYVYYLQGKYTDGKAIEQKGTITLVR